MTGDKICEWFAAKFPLMCRFVGGMTEWEAVAFAIGLMVFMYLAYTAAYNIWLNATGYAQCINDDEAYEEWMADCWEVNT